MSTLRSTSRKTVFEQVQGSLASIAGQDYAGAVCAACAALTGKDVLELQSLAEKRVDFFPVEFHQRLEHLLPQVGRILGIPATGTAKGATSEAFEANSGKAAAPLSALGYYRIGEDGRLYLAAKSAHYHTPLGHSFPGYELLDVGRRLGIPNAIHNNMRGHITRLLEEQLVCRAAGGDHQSSTCDASLLNRVLNLETGSLAAEAALKMVLARFYRAQSDSGAPKYEGLVPVIAAMGDDEGGLKANYHGTTVLTQVMRGMWPGLLDKLEEHNILAVRVVRPNDSKGLQALFDQWDRPPYKIAGLFHELIMMNYGARTLSREFVDSLYALCHHHDVPVVVDEIQTAVWSPQVFMFHEYGIRPAAVVLGKGFPGGEYAASRVVFCPTLDTLPQFGALVTNGQEELASLAYLITMKWAEANAAVTAAVGEYYEERVRELAESFPHLISSIEGRRHMLGVYFQDLQTARAFTSRLQQTGIDISVQTYKESCPPSALTKLPLICSYRVVDWLVEQMSDALARI